MSQENVAVVQRAFVAWNTGDFDAVPCGPRLSASTSSLAGARTPRDRARACGSKQQCSTPVRSGCRAADSGSQGR